MAGQDAPTSRGPVTRGKATANRYMNSKFRRAVLTRVGHRGLFLAVLGLYDLFFGAFLLFGGALQFPLQFTNRTWGWTWVAAGLFLFAGMAFRRDGMFFALAVFIKVAWALEFAHLAVTADSRQWPRAAYYCTLALLVLVAAAWPEPQVRIVAEDAVDRAQAVSDGEDAAGRAQALPGEDTGRQ